MKDCKADFFDNAVEVLEALKTHPPRTSQEAVALQMTVLTTSALAIAQELRKIRLHMEGSK